MNERTDDKPAREPPNIEWLPNHPSMDNKSSKQLLLSLQIILNYNKINSFITLTDTEVI